MKKSLCDDCIKDCVWRAPSNGLDPPVMNCRQFAPKPLTNYDLLIRKTPEEMVKWIESLEPAACPYRDDHGDDCRFTHCAYCWIDWLKKPAEEGGV